MPAIAAVGCDPGRSAVTPRGLRDAKTTHKRLTIEQAQRALYIDFEGREDHAPVLLGTTRWVSAQRVHQYVTDPRYVPIASEGAIEVMTFARRDRAHPPAGRSPEPPDRRLDDP